MFWKDGWSYTCQEEQMITSLWAGADKGETGTVDSLLYLQLARHPRKAPLKDRTPQTDSPQTLVGYSSCASEAKGKVLGSRQKWGDLGGESG